MLSAMVKRHCLLVVFVVFLPNDYDMLCYSQVLSNDILTRNSIYVDGNTVRLQLVCRL